MYLKQLLYAISLSALAACGADDSSSSTQDSGRESRAEKLSAASERNDDKPIEMMVEGAESFTFSYNAMYSCTEDRIEIFTFSHAPNVRLVLPKDVTTGTKELGDFNANGADYPMMYVVGEITDQRKEAGKTRGLSYLNPVNSKLVINSLPAARGEMFDAILTADLQSSDGQQLAVSVEFKVADSGYCKH